MSATKAWLPPLDRRVLNAELRRKRAASATEFQISVHLVSGQALPAFPINGAETIGELRRRALRAADDHPSRSCRLLIGSACLELAEDECLVAEALRRSTACVSEGAGPGITTPSENVSSKCAHQVSVTLVRMRVLWAATACMSGNITLSQMPINTDSRHPPCLEIVFTHEKATSVCFSPDGRHILTASDDSIARLWDIDGGCMLCTLTGHTGGLTSVVFSPHGNMALTTSKDRTARLWQLPLITQSDIRGDLSVVCLHVFCGHEKAVWSGAFSPNREVVLTAARDFTARLWNMDNGEPMHTFSGHEGALWCAAFSPDGDRVATASSDRTARLWSVATGEHLCTLSGHGDTVTRIAFSADGESLLTSSRDGHVRLWASDSGELSASLSATDEDSDSPTHLWTAAYAPDGAMILGTATGGSLWMWVHSDHSRTWGSGRQVGTRSTTVLSCDLCLR